MRILGFTLLMFSQLALATTEEARISNLTLKATSISTIHAHAFFDEDKHPWGQNFLDITCLDGDIRLRLMLVNDQSDFRILELRSESDFYCAATRKLTEFFKNQGRNGQKFEVRVEIKWDKNVGKVSLVEFIAGGETFDLYSVQPAVLGPNSNTLVVVQ